MEWLAYDSVVSSESAFASSPSVSSSRSDREFHLKVSKVFQYIQWVVETAVVEVKAHWIISLVVTLLHLSQLQLLVLLPLKLTTALHHPYQLRLQPHSQLQQLVWNQQSLTSRFLLVSKLQLTTMPELKDRTPATSLLTVLRPKFMQLLEVDHPWIISSLVASKTTIAKKMRIHCLCCILTIKLFDVSL